MVSLQIILVEEKEFLFNSSTTLTEAIFIPFSQKNRAKMLELGYIGTMESIYLTPKVVLKVNRYTNFLYYQKIK